MISTSSGLEGRMLGTYVLERLIGRGGMSVVYLAKQAHLARLVAIKILLPDVEVGSSSHNEFLMRFRQEARVIANLDHVNIIPIYEYDEQDKLAFLVMPYLAGGSLATLLAQHGALSLPQVRLYLEQVAAALDYAHEHGVIHRDLKPRNFLLHRDGHLVLADFGIARIMAGGKSPKGFTLTGAILGTPEYMAPEMALGKSIDARTDIYELGIVLFEMLTGTVPFKGRTAFEVIEQHLLAPLPSLCRINPAIPSSVETVVQTATAKRSEDRYVSAGDMAQALRKATMVHDYPNLYSAPTVPVVSKARHPAPQTLPSPLTRNRPQRLMRVFIWLVVGISLVLALGLTGYVLHDQPVPHQPVPPSPSVSPPTLTATLTPVQQAKAVVLQYYHDWNQRDYQAAYNLLDPDYQNQYSFSKLLPSYQNTQYACIEIISSTSGPSDTVLVEVTDNAMEVSPSERSGVIHAYKVDFTLRQTQNAWRLTPHLSRGAIDTACHIP